MDFTFLMDFDGHQFRKSGVVGLPALILASSDLQYLRIGPQVFRRDEKGAYVQIIIGQIRIC
jgi:hypothetical protein